jgi:hypothetical protein
MTPFTFSLAVGGAGLLTMAVGGLGRHGAGGHHATGAKGGHSTGKAARASSSFLAALASPRVIFSLLVGFGATGILFEHLLSGVALTAVAVLGALAFERLLVTPLWNQMMRFASDPAETLESSIAGEVRAVTSFDADGCGLVAVELDGQITQVLATLRPEDRAAGVHVRTGDRLRVEDVDAARNRCTVSPLLT